MDAVKKRRGGGNSSVGWNGCGDTHIRDDGETARESTDPLAPTSHEQEEQNRHDIHIAGCPAVSRQTGRPVPQQPIDGPTQNRHRDLGNDLSSAECEPAIYPRRVFPCFPQSAVLVEFREDAVDDGGWDEDSEKWGEESILEVGQAVG